MPAVGVIGAGVSGLAAAHRLAGLGHDVVVYEAGDRAGGVVRSERRDGFLAELGPNSFADSGGPAAELISEVGLDGRRVEADPAARRRYVVRGGRPVPLPLSPPALLGSRLFSLRGKLAILREPFVPAAPADRDESVAAFVRRRFGAELLEYAAGPFVSGVYAGDAEALGVRYAFPKLHALELEHGSVLRGLVAGRRGGGAGGRRAPVLVSFRDGLQELPDALARGLGARVRLRAPVLGARREGSGWIVRTGGAESRHDALVLAAPAHALASLELAAPEGARLGALAGIPHPRVAALVLGFRRDEVDHPLDGFGMLVPAVERRRILGVIFSSTLFPGRAPGGHVTLTMFIGGIRHPELAVDDAEALTATAMPDLRDLLGVRGTPAFRTHACWPRAIPQYVVGYQRFLDAFAAIEEANPSLSFAGTARGGVALGDALRSGLDAAQRLQLQLALHS
ncbi:MAG TPA: protoporphyrinogen oxidase [Gemmatimonadales bacterium]|nr:protoporphyrinogen oxidase [Gemmatimonadales bacterium]